MMMREEDEMREEERMRKDANDHSHQLCSLSHGIEPIILLFFFSYTTSSLLVILTHFSSPFPFKNKQVLFE